MPLATCCPNCGRLFLVYAQQLKERRGKIDCAQCGRRFNAVSSLLEEPQTNVRDLPDDWKALRESPSEKAPPAALSDHEERRERSRRTKTIGWSLGILGLTLAAIAQIGWWDRGWWIQQPNVKSVMDAFCGPDGCNLALPRHAGSIEIERAMVLESGKKLGALRLTLSLVNRAVVSQGLPLIQVELFTGHDELMTARRFQPAEYLPRAETRNSLRPSEAIVVLLDLEPPPVPASGFRITLF